MSDLHKIDMEHEQLAGVQLSSYGSANLESPPGSPSCMSAIEDSIVEGQTKLRSLNANATYAALFLAFDFVIFTAAKKENLDNQPHWRKIATLYIALFSVTAHLTCVITAVTYNYVLASLEQLPESTRYDALRKFHSTRLGDYVMEFSAASLLTGIPLGLCHSGLMLKVHFSETHSDVAAGWLFIVSCAILYSGYRAFRYVKAYYPDGDSYKDRHLHSVISSTPRPSSKDRYNDPRGGRQRCSSIDDHGDPLMP